MNRLSKSSKLHWGMVLPRTSLAAILGPALCVAVFAQAPPSGAAPPPAGARSF